MSVFFTSIFLERIVPLSVGGWGIPYEDLWMLLTMLFVNVSGKTRK